MVKNKIKIVESGYEDNPGVIIGEIDGNKLIFRSCLFKENCYFKMTKSQAKSLVKFLNNFIEDKNE